MARCGWCGPGVGLSAEDTRHKRSLFALGLLNVAMGLGGASKHIVDHAQGVPVEGGRIAVILLGIVLGAITTLEARRRMVVPKWLPIFAMAWLTLVVVGLALLVPNLTLLTIFVLVLDAGLVWEVDARITSWFRNCLVLLSSGLAIRHHYLLPPSAITPTHSIPLVDIVVPTIVFSMDFYFTRNFAAALLEQNRAMQASINLAERLASDLADMDLESAEGLLQDTQDATPLRSTFGRILVNLKRYRPHLPDTLFAHRGSQDTAGEEAQLSPRCSETTSPSARNIHHRRTSTASSSSIVRASGIQPLDLPKRANLTLGLRRETQVSVVVTRLIPDPVVLINQGAALRDIQDSLQHYFELVLPVIKATGGHIHSVQGGKITSSWGAAGPLGGVAARACQCAHQILRDFQASPPPPISPPRSACERFQCISSVVTGCCTVGIAGTNQHQAFQLLGSQVTLGQHLVDFNTHLGTSILTSAAVKDVVQYYYIMREVDRWLVDGVHDAPVYSLVGPKEMEEEEWMYQLQHAEGSATADPLGLALACMVNGKWQEAKQILAEAMGSDHLANHYHRVCVGMETGLGRYGRRLHGIPWDVFPGELHDSTLLPPPISDSGLRAGR